MLGFVVSTTTTWLAQVAVRPAWSVAVCVAAVVPSGYDPIAGSLIVTVPQTSLPSAVPADAVAALLPVHSFVTSPGQVIVGGVVSTTVTVEVQAAALPLESWAL